MFGDFEADMEAPLSGYARKLTGVQSAPGKRAGRLCYGDRRATGHWCCPRYFPAGAFRNTAAFKRRDLPGSETVVLEVRDRRNPT